MEKVSQSTDDLVQGNIDAIADLFPNVVTEAFDSDGNIARAIDFDRLRQELADQVVDGPRERYQLDWPGKRAAVLAANAPTRATLRPMREESVDFDTTQNIFIEGDNLEALKLLQESYLGKVKLIYIDPPYNTGNDFIYEDDFAETTAEYLERSGQIDATGARLVANTEANGRFHSDWLSMMCPRLKLAKSFLSDDGVIAVSIDDNEQARLIQLLDEVFGASNKVAQVVVQANKGGRDYLPLAQTHEYLVIYARTPGVGVFDLPRDQSQHPLSDEVGPYEARELRNRNPKFHKGNRPNLYYAFYVNPDLVDANGYAAVSLEPEEGYSIAAYPKNSQGVESCWRWGREKSSQAIQVNEPSSSQVVARQVRTGGWNVYEKHRPTTQKAKTIWDETEVRTEAGTREIRELFGASVFDHPKPVDLLKKLLAVTTTSAGESLVLDFFAGSGSTAHAVFDLNRTDGGNRRFILVQLPEECESGSEAARAGFSTISQVAQQRLRLAGGTMKAQDLDTGFRVLRVDSGSFVEVLETPDDTNQSDLVVLADNIKSDRTDDDLVFQVMVDWGLDLSLPMQREQHHGIDILDVDGGAVIACFASPVNMDLVRTIAKRKPVRAVFRDSSFATDADRINVEQVFREISPDTQVRVI